MIGLYSLVINFWTSTAQDLTIICHMAYLIIVVVFDCNAAPPINTFLPWPAHCAAISHLAFDVTVPVNKDAGYPLIGLVDHSDPLPVVVSLSPLLTNATLALDNCGIAAGVLGNVRPPKRSLNQACLVSLLAHIKPLQRHPHNPLLFNSSPSFQVHYLPAHRVPNRETTARFKQAALRLPDRLARDALQPASKRGYIKIVTMLEDIANAHTP